jgi:hypothetical protein
MSNPKLEAAREFILGEDYQVARVILTTMKTSPTAKKWLTKLQEIAPQECTMNQWEYLEVYVKAVEKIPSDLQAILEDNHFTTVEHFYSRLLNEYGAQGWELFSEDAHGGDLIRLLFKRMKPRQ